MTAIQSDSSVVNSLVSPIKGGIPTSSDKVETDNSSQLTGNNEAKKLINSYLKTINALNKALQTTANNMQKISAAFEVTDG